MARFCPRFALPVLAALVLALGAVARGDEGPGDVARAQAKALKDRASEAMALGDHQTALRFFVEANQLFPSPNLRFNVGLALEKLGRDIEAADAFQAYIAGAPGPGEALEHARARIAAVAALAGRIELASQVAGAEVRLDGVPVGQTPLARPLWVTPGRHVITLHQPGQPALTVELVAPAGTTTALTRDLPPPRPPHLFPTAPVVEIARPLPAYRRWWVWTLTAGLLAAGGVGVAIAADTTGRAPPGDVYWKPYFP